MQQVINMSHVFSHLLLMPNQTVMKTEQDPQWGLEGGVRVMKQVIGSTWPSERPMCTSCFLFNVFTYCDQCLDYAGPRDVVSCVKVFVFTETGGFIAFNDDKNIKNVLLLCSPPRCPIPEMHENVWLRNAEDELLHRHQVLQRWPVQHLWWISMMAPRGRRALKSSRSSTTHVGSRWMKVHFQWGQTCIVKNWTNKTIEKRSLWCLWMHCDCLGMVLVKFRNSWVWFGLIC